MRLIDADSIVYESIDSSDTCRHEHYYGTGILAARKEDIDAMQTIEEHKTGKWIYKNDLKQFFCSECGYPSLTYDDTYIYGMDLPNYCEDCGADMRED